jgi:hypothetical protein
MIFKSKEEKLTWAKTLIVGDTVCDCRFRHLKIAKLDEVYNHTQFSHPIYKMLLGLYGWFSGEDRYSEWVAGKLIDPVVFFLTENVLRKRVDPFLLKFGLTERETVDFDIELEDGAQCSALYCCDPADHEEGDCVNARMGDPAYEG